MAQGKPQLKFERNPYNNFRDNRCHRRTTDGRTTNDGRRMDGRRTTDACAMTVALRTKTSRAKNGLEIWRRRSYQQNMGLSLRTDDGRTRDGRTDDGRLRYDSSSADKVKQS